MTDQRAQWQITQGNACGCRGVDEYCPCQNTDRSRPMTDAAREQTSRAFVPVEGQSFSSEQDWINRATRSLTAHAEYNNTEHGEQKGWRGHHFTALCFDQAGNRMRQGSDFTRATNEGTYPVWWIWPDQVGTALSKLAGEA